MNKRRVIVFCVFLYFNCAPKSAVLPKPCGFMCLSLLQELIKARWRTMGSTGTPLRAASAAPAVNAPCWVGPSCPSRDKSSARAPAVSGRNLTARTPRTLPSKALAPPESPDAAPKWGRVEEVVCRRRGFPVRWTHCLYKWIFWVSPAKRQVWLASRRPGRTRSEQVTDIIMNPNQTRRPTPPLSSFSASATSGLPLPPSAPDRIINSRITGSRTMQL